MVRRLLREPQAQELSIQLASSLSERAVTRTIRAVFNVRQPRYDESTTASGDTNSAASTGSR